MSKKGNKNMRLHFHLEHRLRKKHDHGKRTLSIDQYAVNSGLAYASPELKVMIGISSLIICLLSSNGITSIMVAIVMMFITLFYGKIKAIDYWHLILIPFTFILLSAIALLVDLSKYKMGYIDIPVLSRYLVITKANILSAFVVSIKALCGVNCLYMISLSTPLYEIIGVLKRCKVPEIVIELMYLIYRFIFILLETYQNMKTAADTRLGYINLKRSYYSFFGVCSNLFVVAFKKASKSFDAMEARCYDGKLIFLESKKLITAKQISYVGIYFILIIISLVLERIWL